MVYARAKGEKMFEMFEVLMNQRDSHFGEKERGKETVSLL